MAKGGGGFQSYAKGDIMQSRELKKEFLQRKKEDIKRGGEMYLTSFGNLPRATRQKKSGDYSNGGREEGAALEGGVRNRGVTLNRRKVRKLPRIKMYFWSVNPWRRKDWSHKRAWCSSNGGGERLKKKMLPRPGKKGGVDVSDVWEKRRENPMPDLIPLRKKEGRCSARQAGGKKRKRTMKEKKESDQNRMQKRRPLPSDQGGGKGEKVGSELAYSRKKKRARKGGGDFLCDRAKRGGKEDMVVPQFEKKRRNWARRLADWKKKVGKTKRDSLPLGGEKKEPP